MTLRSIVTAAAAALLLAGCSPKDAFDSYCRSSLEPPVLQVDIDIEPLTVDHSHSRAEISQQLRADGTPVEGSLAMGSTTASLEQRSSMRFNQRSLLGFACAKPHATLKLTLAHPAVYIAKEFPRGSCRYRTVELHEMMHVQVYEAALARTAAKAKVLFDLRYPQSTLLTGMGEEELARRAGQDLDEWLVPAISQELAQARARQRALDNVQEYTRLTLACPDEPLPAQGAEAVPPTTSPAAAGR